MKRSIVIAMPEMHQRLLEEQPGGAAGRGGETESSYNGGRLPACAEGFRRARPKESIDSE